MGKYFLEPTLIEKGDTNILINGEAPCLDYRLITDELYLKMKDAYNRECAKAKFSEREQANDNIPLVSHFYSVGDIVPYKNTRGNRKYAVITEFKQIERNKKWWFYGVDTYTQAKVFYPEHLSRALDNCG